MIAVGRRALRETTVVLVAAGAEMLALENGGGGVATRVGTIPAWSLGVATVAICSLLPLRHRHPMAVFGTQWAFSLVTLLVPTFIHFAGTLVALYAVARTMPRRTAGLALAACAVPFTINALSARSYSDQPMDTPAEFWGTVAVVGTLWAVVLSATWLLGRLSFASDQRAALERELHAARADEAVRAERLRLARELHDIVANAVSVVILTAAGTRQALGPAADQRALGALDVIGTAGQQAASELDRLLALLRDRTEGDDRDGAEPAGRPGLEDLPALVALARASGLHVRLRVDGDRAPLTATASLAAYRTVQEALTNAAKYADHDAPVEVRLGWSASELAVSVRSRAGNGARPRAQVPSTGRGLTGLAERIKLVDGTLHVGQMDDGTFLVRASLPVVDRGESVLGHGRSGEPS